MINRSLLKNKIIEVLEEKPFKTMLREALKNEFELDREKIENLKPDDVVIVYHGTNSSHLQELLNGVDTTKIKHRYYTNGYRHAGLFVTPSFETALLFGRIVIKFRTKAKNLHGTNYGGTIGREQEKRGEDMKWIKEKYPNSFRPYLSLTLLQNVEPQALHLGVIPPDDILGVKWNKDEDWKPASEFHGTSLGGHGRNSKVQIHGVDLSNPNMTVEDLIKVIGVSEEKFFRFLPYRLKRYSSPEEYAEYLSDEFGIGLGRIASSNLAKKLWKFRES